MAAVPSALLAACGAGGSASTTPTPVPTPTGLTPQQASRFLGQAAWGANPTTLKALTDQGMNTWLTQQMAMPLSQSMTSWMIEKGYNDAAVSGNINGVDISGLYQADGTWKFKDGKSSSDTDLMALATATQPLTFTCLPPGTGVRTALKQTK